jgi:hypothetical protein
LALAHFVLREIAALPDLVKVDAHLKMSQLAPYLAAFCSALRLAAENLRVVPSN